MSRDMSGLVLAVVLLAAALWSRCRAPLPVQPEKLQAAAVPAVPPEVVAAISAAVCVLYGEQAKVCSVRRAVSGSSRAVWRQAGILENTRPFLGGRGTRCL